GAKSGRQGGADRAAAAPPAGQECTQHERFSTRSKSAGRDVDRRAAPAAGAGERQSRGRGTAGARPLPPSRTIGRPGTNALGSAYVNPDRRARRPKNLRNDFRPHPFGGVMVNDDVFSRL